jgi:hypothetical protein
MARTRVPVAVAGRRARNERSSRRGSCRCRTGAERGQSRGSGWRAGRQAKRPASAWPAPPRRHTIVFWHYLVQTGEVDPAAAGRGLRMIHDSLADYDGELPTAGRAAEVRAMLAPFAPSSDVDLLCELASRELPGGQALHGDAHLFNRIQTATGPIWHDLETACRGPREYDLAALLVSDRSGDPEPEARTAADAYRPYDEGILEQALPVTPPGWPLRSWLQSPGARMPRQPSSASCSFCVASATRGGRGRVVRSSAAQPIERWCDERVRDQTS